MYQLCFLYFVIKTTMCNKGSHSTSNILLFGLMGKLVYFQRFLKSKLRASTNNVFLLTQLLRNVIRVAYHVCFTRYTKKANSFSQKTMRYIGKLMLHTRHTDCTL